MYPANHVAGNCLINGAGDEKTIWLALLQLSRLPKPDQIGMGHTPGKQ